MELWAFESYQFYHRSVYFAKWRVFSSIVLVKEYVFFFLSDFFPSRFDENGNYQNIGHNNFTRSSFINAKFEDVEKFYRAYYVWTKLINSDENKVKHKLKPGEIFAFDNIRILHGRTQFDPSISSRYLEGMYIDWDEVYSTLRVLRRKLGFVENDKNAWDWLVISIADPLN